MHVVNGMIFSLLILSFSCTEPKNKESFQISGKIENTGDRKIIFREIDVESYRNIDSVILDDIGLFRFTYSSKEEGFFVLKFSTGEQIVLLTRNGEDVFIETDLGRKPFIYTVKGSPGSSALQEFYAETEKNISKADSLRSVLMLNRESPDFYQLSLSFDTLFMKIIEEQKVIQKTFIEENHGSLASLLVLNYKFGLVPVLNIKDDFAVYQGIDSVLMKKYPSNKHVLFHHQRVLGFLRQEKEKEMLKK